MPKYTRAEVIRMVEEFASEFDTIVKAEVAKTGQALRKSEDSDKDSKKDSKKEESSSGGDDKSSSGGGDKKPPPDGPPSGGDASAGGPPPPADPASASAGGPPGDPASAGGVPPADPAAGASTGDPVQALIQAYSQLSPEELQSHFFAMKEVLNQQMAVSGAPSGGVPGADPMAASVGADPAMGGAAPSPAGPGAGAPPPTPVAAGPDAAAPLAAEGSKPVDPAAQMAMKSLQEENDNLKKSLASLTETLEKFVRPERKAIQGTDLNKSESGTKTVTMTREQIIKKLAVVAHKPDLSKSDREAINKYCVGAIKVDGVAHLLG